MADNKVKKIQSDKQLINSVRQMLRGEGVSVVFNGNLDDGQQWTVHGENYPYELADIRDNFYDVTISVKDGDEEYGKTITKESTLNSVRLWYLEQLLKKYSKSGKFDEIVREIKYINDILTILANPGARVTVVNEVIPVLKEYEIIYDINRKMTIAFNGSLVKIKTENGQRDFNKVGYIDLKLGVLQRALDNNIKQQQRDYARKVLRCKWHRRITPLRYKLSDMVLGRNNSL